MIPILFINSALIPFVDMILSGQKTIETRSKNMLRALVGRRVLIAETGHGRPVVRCSARITYAVQVTSKDVYDAIRDCTRVPEGSPYDWKESTRCKWFYTLTDVIPVSPFSPPEGRRHGRVWMEYNRNNFRAACGSAGVVPFGGANND